MAEQDDLLEMLSRDVLCDVLTRTLCNIDSVSSNLDIRNNIDEVLVNRKPFVFYFYNDFGIIVRNLSTMRYALMSSAVTTPCAVSEFYSTTMDMNPQFDNTLNELSFSLAGVLITAHFILRDQIPEEVIDVSTMIEEDLKSHITNTPLALPNVTIQNWGSLCDETRLSRIFYLCREKARIFEETRPIRAYYATAAFSAADQIVAETLPEALTKEATELFAGIKINDAVPMSEAPFYFNILFRSYGVRNLVIAARSALDNGTAFNEQLNQIFYVEKLLEDLSIRCSQYSDSGISAELAEWLSRQIARLEEAILLISGGLYALAMTTYNDALILSGHNDIIVNSMHMAAYEAAGGTLEKLQIIGFYLKNHHLHTPRYGWSMLRMLDISDVAEAEYVTKRVDTQRRLQADNTTILRAVTDRVLQKWLELRPEAPWKKTPDFVMNTELNRLLNRVTSPKYALADLLTDYLVGIRNNKLLTFLKDELYINFSKLPENATDIEQRNAVANAMLKISAEFLVTSYAQTNNA